MTGQPSLPPTHGPLADVTALHLDKDREKSQQEYEIIRDAFMRLLEHWDNSAESLEILTDIITRRCASLIERMLDGLSLDFDRALVLLRNHNDFTTYTEREQRDILVAAIGNLVDFAASGQYTLLRELPEQPDGNRYDEYEDICRRYNLTWAMQENEDVHYAAVMAAWWTTVSSDTMLTFMTQGDERVRPWHEALEGVSYPKREFPSELIPPIEYACRCYLVAEGFGSVVGALPEGKPSFAVHPVFRESLCTGGRIFSGEHPYFRHPLPLPIQKIVRSIKQKFYLL